MGQKKETKHSLMMHCQKYPCLQIQDIMKFLHQSSFGCEHMVSDLDAVIERICKERETLKSAQKEPEGMNEFEVAIAEWKSKGYPALHHSDEFRATYHPSYRVIANRYVPFLPVLAKIDEMLQQKSVVIAIDGRSASGKTTFSEMLKEIYDCNVLHMDDFFLRPEQRTPERFAEVGGNIDRERFLEEVLMPLEKNESIQYRRFDCATFTMWPPVAITPKKLTIIEGAYSMHPAFAKYYDLSVFLDVSEELQKQRIERRNTVQMAKRFFEEWIPLENIYFTEMQVKERCDLLITV